MPVRELRQPKAGTNAELKSMVAAVMARVILFFSE